MHRLSGALALRARMSGLLGALIALPAVAEQPDVRELRI